MICTNKLTGAKAEFTLLTQFPAKYRGLRISAEHPYLVEYSNGVFFALSEENFHAQFEKGEKPEEIKIDPFKESEEEVSQTEEELE